MRWNPALLDLSLEEVDPQVADAIAGEAARQRHCINLMAPSMFAPLAIRQAISSVLNDIDGEGYIGDWQENSSIGSLADFCAMYGMRGARKYNPAGPFAEFVEHIAARRIAELFSAGTGLRSQDLYVNVQPLSGSNANIAILRAVLDPGDPLLSLKMTSGGHLSHGAGFHYSGSTYRVSHYRITEQGDLDLDNLESTIRADNPKAVIVGGSSYPRIIDWKAIRAVIDAVPNRPLMIADVAHFSGLIAAQCYPSPLPYADLVSMVAYKTLGGPRIGTIVTHDAEISHRVDSALFPGIQSAPVMGAIAGLAVAARIASTTEFRSLMSRAIENSRVLAHALEERDVKLAFGGTDTHMLLLSLPQPSIPVVSLMERAGILTNSNVLPGDNNPKGAHGIRIGTVGVTERGLCEGGAREIGALLADVIHRTTNVSGNCGTDSFLNSLRENVRSFCDTNLSLSSVLQSGHI